MTVNSPIFDRSYRKTGNLLRIAEGFSFLALSGGIVSIALSHACMVVALVLLIVSRTMPRFPPIKTPVFVFLGLTVFSLLASDMPWDGLPQIKKFFVFSFLPISYWVFRHRGDAFRLLQACFLLASVAASVSIVQFAVHWYVASAARVDFYQSYVGHRISGFFSHWMTFSEVGLLVFLAMASYLLFSKHGKGKTRVFWIGCGILVGVSLLLSFTRSVWVAVLICSMYLIWHWKKKALLFVFIVVIIAVMFAPNTVLQRVSSINPTDNPARLLMWETGFNMIKAYPWLGVGPERVGPLFEEFTVQPKDEWPDAYYGHLHNMYIHYAAERGLPAALVLIWFLIKVLIDCRRALASLPRVHDDDRCLLHAAEVVTLGVIVVGGFDLTLGDSEILSFYLTVVGLGYGAIARITDRSIPT